MTDTRIRNMEQFAAVSGISRPTLSKYFQDQSSVRASTRARIEAALAQHDFRPNIYAINQNRRHTRNIGIVVPMLADPFFAEIARSIEMLSIEAGFRPIMLNSLGDPGQELNNLDSLRSIRPAGVLMAPLGRRSDKSAVKAFCEDVPTVLFDSHIDGVGEAFVGSNNDQSIDAIVRLLVDTGEPPALFEMRTPTNPNAYKRRSAYCAAMERLGYEPMLLQADGDGWDFEAIGYREGTRLISQNALPTNTVLCSNDRLAIGFLSAAFELGLTVGRGPEHALRIAGHDDHPFSRYTCPTLTTVSQDYASIANASVETLLTLIDMDGSFPNRDTTLFDGRLIRRNSA